MGRSVRGLAPDEQVVLRLRTHGSVLVVPALALIVLGGALGAGMALVGSPYRPAGQYGVAIGVLALALRCSVRPFLRWWGRTYTITTHRLVTRQGILRRDGHTMPLTRVVDVSCRRNLSDRVYGCGTLVVQTAAEGALVLDDVPAVRHTHRVLTDLVLAVAPPQPPPPPEQTPSEQTPYERAGWRR